jgi:hypothetical protein
MEGLAHAPPRREAPGKLILFADYPKIGLGDFETVCDMQSLADYKVRRPMEAIAPASIRYIKLGRAGLWEEASLRRGELHLGFKNCPHETALKGSREEIVQALAAAGSNEHAARDAARQILDFYQLGPDCLWITLANGHLWWTFAEAGVIPLDSELKESGVRMRRTIGGWKNCDINGRAIRAVELSSRLTKVAAYRQTICEVQASDYLLRKINNEEDPLLVGARRAREHLLESAQTLLAGLHWADFETLVDIIFARDGWHRVSALGRTEKDADMVLEQVTTNETALVQVKSTASQRVLDDYIERFDANPTWTRMFFVCHAPKGSLDAGGRREIRIVTGEELAEMTVRTGLFDWLLARAA